MNLILYSKNKYKMFPRKLEQFYTHSDYITEFWNTVSNIPFILIGIARLYEGTSQKLLYSLYILAGVCSGFHHATPWRETIVIDWIPIALSIVLGLYWQILYTVSVATFIKLVITFGVLVNDHVWTTVPAPYGHVFWHILAAFTIDEIYTNI